jgi:hypothetical protein
MIAKHKIESIRFDQNFIYLNIDGNDFQVALESLSLKLKSADEYQRMFYKISPSGYGIHWPLIDEDLSIEGILKLQ